MVEPNMATMLVYIFTDVRLEAATLDSMLRHAAHVSFNMLSIDTDTSTSDTCAILANGLAGTVNHAAFQEALTFGSIAMSQILARDGEGATKLLRIHVEHAASENDARAIAKSIVNSPLIKTMAFGADPNVGRILMAIGKCFTATVRPDSTSASVNGIDVLRDGRRTDFDETRLRTSLQGDPVDIHVSLGVGHASATAFGCDLTDGYIRENAAYYST
jgi:glutamate N-acetyltransferase/amino-acid N-acetyltransferase